jgi:hypothetical protein
MSRSASDIAKAQEKSLGDVIFCLTLELGERIIPSVMSDSYQKALDDARKELADLPKQRQVAIEFFNLREVQLKKIIEGLEPICDTIGQLAGNPTILDLIADDYEPGLQESVAAILRAHAPSILPPTMVRDELERVGVNTTHYSNAMATIHRALGRLADDPKSRIVAVKEDGKIIGYKYTGVPPEPGTEYAALLRRFAPPTSRRRRGSQVGLQKLAEEALADEEKKS